MRKYWWLLALLAGLNIGIGRAQANHTDVMLDLLDQMVEAQGFDTEVIEMLDEIAASGDTLYIAPLIDLGFFVRGRSSPLFETLQTLSEQPFEADWQRYFEWASASDIALPERYDEWKGTLFSRLIDPQFARFWDNVQPTAQVNLLEPLWGGVQVDGIPSLVNARQISPEEALAEGEAFPQFCRAGDCRYPAPDEFVFGVSIDGDNRAYPLRLLNWHEMFNDVIGRAPLYDAPNGQVICYFRAPTPFAAVARQGNDWVQIVGESAGCPAGGWLDNPENLNWPEIDGWDEASMSLPDLAVNGTAMLEEEAGVAGSVAGKPVMLAYCTLCGSGILYDPAIPDLIVNGESQGETVLEFGSTGMLMRSNKLMYDRNTDTVWNAMTGEPAFGPLADSGIRLKMLSVVVIDWATWLEEHPDTSVLSLQTGYRRNYINGAAYSDYFNDPTFLMFPVWQQDTSENANKEIIFALNLDDIPKAYPLETIIAEGVTNDIVGETPVVIISRATPERAYFEPGGAAVRAYASESYTFAAGVNRSELIDQNGTIWIVTEEALIGPENMRLERLGGHLAFWFGWYSFYPNTLVYQGSTQQ
jgi:hypothetical protein